MSVRTKVFRLSNLCSLLDFICILHLIRQPTIKYAISIYD